MLPNRKEALNTNTLRTLRVWAVVPAVGVAAAGLFTALGYALTVVMVEGLENSADTIHWTLHATLAIAVPAFMAATALTVVAVGPCRARRRLFVGVSVLVAVLAAMLHRALLVGPHSLGVDPLLVLNLVAVVAAGTLAWHAHPWLRVLSSSKCAAAPRAASQATDKVTALALWAALVLGVIAIPFSPGMPIWHPLADNAWTSPAAGRRPADGKWTRRCENGMVASEGYFGDGHRVGTWKVWDCNGNLLRIGNYEHDEPVGLWREWDSKGNPVSSGGFVAGKRDGEWITWHDGCRVNCDDPKVQRLIRDGIPVREGRLGVPEDCSMRDSGQRPAIASQGRYRLGERVRTWTYWHENGEKSAEGSFIDDKPHGIWMYWNANGLVLATVEWRYGAQHACELGELPTFEEWRLCWPANGPLPRCLRDRMFEIER